MREAENIDPTLLPGLGPRYVRHPGPYAFPIAGLEVIFPGILDEGLVDLRDFPRPLYGEMNGSETFALAHIARWMQPRTFVEFGTFYGRSSAIVSRLTDARILTVDLSDEERKTRLAPDSTDDPFLRATEHPIGYHLLEGFGLRDEVTLERMDVTSPAFADRLEEWLDGETIDLALVDATHDYGTTELLFNLALRHLSVGGVIINDDYGSKPATHAGVTSYFLEQARTSSRSFYWFKPFPCPPSEADFKPEMGNIEDWKDPSTLFYIKS